MEEAWKVPKSCLVRVGCSDGSHLRPEEELVLVHALQALLPNHLRMAHAADHHIYQDSFKGSVRGMNTSARVMLSLCWPRSEDRGMVATAAHHVQLQQAHAAAVGSHKVAAAGRPCAGCCLQGSFV
jgi:hypothetical protein